MRSAQLTTPSTPPTPVSDHVTCDVTTGRLGDVLSSRAAAHWSAQRSSYITQVAIRVRGKYDHPLPDARQSFITTRRVITLIFQHLIAEAGKLYKTWALGRMGRLG